VPGRVLYFGLRTVTDTAIDIPNRAAFRAAEVCEIAQIPPYVLRSWEKEFPGLGATARPGGPRIYRRSDIEQILRIKQMVYTEGLTLAGVRRRIEGEPPAEEEALLPPPVTPEVRSRVDLARRELRELLEMLSGGPATVESSPAVEAAASAEPTEKAAHPPAGAAAMDEAAAEAADLPLLNGLLDTPPKPRRGRRTGKQAPWGGSSEVE
jgi:DNA-binding transcriptional MerR regulator